MSQPNPASYSTRYATPEAREYSQLTQPLQLGSPSMPSISSMSSHTSANNPRSYGHADPPPAKCLDIGGLLVVAAARAEREEGTQVVREAAAAKPKGRKVRLQTEEEQKINALKAEAKAANEEARAKKAAVKAATAAAMTARKEAQRTAKELAAKKNKNKKESRPLADQTQQADFKLPFRSSQ
ncbi:MAG: hypothetical protein M1812_004543 [Candelaria pacifica]|nr:MAG: hypothetical protein M1812_004543 [Candelaria pacifica]